MSLILSHPDQKVEKQSCVEHLGYTVRPQMPRIH